MFLQVLLFSLLGLCLAQDPDDSNNHPPHPYSFAYDTTNEFGTRLAQSETGDEDNVKRGSYSYSDANGLFRVVNYIADKDGFRVTIDTNEPGTKTSAPAGVQYNSQAVEPPHPVVSPALSSNAKLPAAQAAVRALAPIPVVLAPVPTSTPDLAKFVAPVTFSEHSFLAQPQPPAAVVGAPEREGTGRTQFSLRGNVPLTYTFGKAL